jgi:hypothetical protein
MSDICQELMLAKSETFIHLFMHESKKMLQF